MGARVTFTNGFACVVCVPRIQSSFENPINSRSVLQRFLSKTKSDIMDLWRVSERQRPEENTVCNAEMNNKTHGSSTRAVTPAFTDASVV